MKKIISSSTTVDGRVVVTEVLDADGRHRGCDGLHWVAIVRPYDLARYHYAFSRDGEHWDLYRKAGFGSPQADEYKGAVRGTPKQVLVEVRRLDREIAPQIDLS